MHHKYSNYGNKYACIINITWYTQYTLYDAYTEISSVTAHGPLKWSIGKSGGWAVMRVQNFGGGYASLELGLGVGGYTGHGRLHARFWYTDKSNTHGHTQQQR